MNNEKNIVTTHEDEQYDLIKKIGKTTYMVKAHFNPASKETMADKIMRMIRYEVSKM